MPQAAPQHDAVVAAGSPGELFVLVELSPVVRVLAVAAHRNRLIREMAELYGLDHDRGLDPDYRLAVRPAPLLG